MKNKNTATAKFIGVFFIEITKNKFPKRVIVVLVVATHQEYIKQVGQGSATAAG